MPRTLVALLILCVATPAVAGTFTTYQAIEYASPAGQSLLMDLRVPDGPGPHPVILYLHSGAWITGDRFGGPALRQATRGYAVASIDYRLAPRHIWPAQIEDAKAVCLRCEVRTQCLAWALDTAQDAGVWGGTSEEERRIIRRARRALCS